MSYQPYPSDVTDDGWIFVSRYLTLMRDDASQRDHKLLWLAKSGMWLDGRVLAPQTGPAGPGYLADGVRTRYRSSISTRCGPVRSGGTTELANFAPSRVAFRIRVPVPLSRIVRRICR